MATTIKLKNSVTTTNAPSSLAQGEVAINITDKKVWVGNAATTPIQLLGDGGSASFTSIAFGAGTVSNPSITFTGDTNTGIYSPAADTIAFTEGGVESMRIDSSGNVGIGTSSPSARLHVQGGVGLIQHTAATLQINSTTAGQVPFVLLSNSADSSNSYIYCPNKQLGIVQADASASSIVYFSTQNTERMRIDSSGNVGIGTSSPSYKLQTVGQAFFGTAGDTIQIRLGNNTAANYWGIGRDNVTTGDLVFQSTTTERMRITSGGEVLVGTTDSTLGAGAGIVLGGASQSSESAFTVAASGNVPIRIYNRGSSGTQYCMEFRNSSTSVGSITFVGSTTTYATSSDYRLKENIAPMQNALGVVAQLKPVTYIWKSNGSAGQGFIAHELQAVVPDAVVGEKDAVDADGKPVYQGVDTSFLVATLTAAIQEQQKMIETLQAEVALLKSK